MNIKGESTPPIPDNIMICHKEYLLFGSLYSLNIIGVKTKINSELNITEARITLSKD